jgi:Cu/Ag efflux pump CusA
MKRDGHLSHDNECVDPACLGGILALLVTGIPFSVSAAVGFISIFGIAVMDGILLSTYIRQLWDRDIRSSNPSSWVPTDGFARP